MEEITTVTDIDLGRALAAVTKGTRAADPAPKARREALAMIEEETLVVPMGSYGLSAVREVRDGWFHLGGGTTLHAPAFAPFSELIGCFGATACSLGPALECRVAALCAENRLSLGLALDELGNELLRYTSRLVALKILRSERRRGRSTSMLALEGKDLPLAEQKTALSLAGGRRIGVNVTGMGVLFPIKSRVSIVGLGDGLPMQTLCERCKECASRDQCRYRGRGLFRKDSRSM